ncbi:hypothetical protein [Actinoplanes teichomyceticus]|uniref:Uncharacterized protein n=1 Tax=Actinoplanes teichomyceticus TaxID=1867 RepID=A0A561VIB4_ACTTI|nr:hypothetical protein [Actinoplanes teichomyceticus]TWG11352.1 hypothetical protein FHX34_10682 [Actinoplanes teichomyceticus]GIF15832.1 hypothetical protein Ate01nite_58640 [Actinoplanes teichomyceticus]
MNVVSQMLLADPVAPVAIWLVLVLVSLPALLLLASPQALRHPRLAALETLGVARRYRHDRERARRRAAETVRYADEVRVAAARAHEAAGRWQRRWEQAEERCDSAWQAWQQAEQRVGRARAAAAFGVPGAARTAADYAARERHLHRAVRAAVERGDLPAAALTAAVAGRDGWDPRLHPVQQELVLLRAVAAHRHRLFRQAAVAERTAWHDAQLAAATRDSLRREAALAHARADAVRHDLPAREHRAAPAGRGAWVQRAA